MAILYKANETDFSHLGLGPLNDAISILVTEERNGIFELEMKYPVSGKVFHELKNDRIIKADAGHKLKDQRFKIIRITKPLKGIVTVYAEHVSYLTQDLALKPKVTFNGNARQALEHWKANLVDDNPFTVWSDISTTGKINWTIDEVENARRALGGVQGSILDVYGGEYLFDNYDIYLYQKRGVNSELLIAYGRNLVDLEQEEEIANTYTSIYPYSIYTDDDGNERMVTLPEYYIDSEHVDKYARRKILVVDFTTDEIETVSALRSASRRYIKDNDVGVPKVNLKIQYVDLAKTLDYKHLALYEEVNLCDNVMIYFEKYDINTTAKVIKVVWDVLNERYDSIEVGEARASLSQAIDTVVDGKVHNVEKLAMQTLRTADGKNTIYFGLEEPLATQYPLKKNDIWYRIVEGEFTRTYRYDGVVWELIIDMDSQEAKQEAQQAKDRADDAVNRANQATQTANTAIGQAQAGFDLALENALELETLGLRFDDVEGNLTTISGTVDGLQTTVSDVQGNVSNLTQLSTTLQTRLTDAEGNINTLTQTVDTTVSRISSLANPNLISHDPNAWEIIGDFFVSPKGFIFGERYAIEPNETYTITNYSVNGELVIALYGNSYREITLSKGESITFTTGTDEKHYAISVADADPDFLKKLGTEYRFKLEEGTDSTAWTAHDEDIYTQYSQLSDAINLRVAKGDVINQINLDTSGVLISGKKLVLDGDTTVKGTFKVGNANITSIDAGKITVGDLVGHSLVGGSVIGGYIEQQSGGNRVEIYNGTVSHYRYGELKSTMDGSGHKFYQSGSYIGNIGTGSWVDDDNYRGLLFSLENKADYMTWAFRKNQSDENPTTMLAWHKTSNKDNKGFTFNDNVHILHNSNLYVSRILTTGYTTGHRAVELQNYNWDGDGGVLLTRAPSRGDRTAGLFMTSKRAVLIDGGNASIEVGNDSTGNYVKSIDIWNRTSSNSSNVRVGSSGKLYRTSSASKYKLLIENEEEKGYNYNNILNLNIKSWYDKLEADTLCDLITNGLTDCENEEKFYLRRHFGLVAEDLEEAGLKEFIDYNDETGEIEGIKYDRLWTLLIPITRQHRDDIEWLKLENQYLKQKVKILEEKVV